MKQSIFQRSKRAVRLWLARRLPDCKDITPTIGESLDRKLSLRENLIMRLHLLTCRPCTNYLKEILFLRETAAQIGEKRLAETESSSIPKLNSDAKERLKDMLRASGNFSF